MGQARKSLWIETAMGSVFIRAVPQGQARKSLWIETAPVESHRMIFPVRLVRACGSKPA